MAFRIFKGEYLVLTRSSDATSLTSEARFGYATFDGSVHLLGNRATKTGYKNKSALEKFQLSFLNKDLLITARKVLNEMSSGFRYERAKAGANSAA